MVASEDNFILGISLNGCFSKTAAKIYYLRNSKLDIFYISYCDAMLKRNKFLWIFSGKSFREKCRHTEVDLYIIQKQYFSSKNPFYYHYSQTATP